MQVEPVQSRHPCGLGKQRLRLGQYHLTPTLEITEQAVAIRDADIFLGIQQRTCGMQRLVITLLLVGATVAFIKLGVFLAHLLDGLLGLLLEISVEMLRQ